MRSVTPSGTASTWRPARSFSSSRDRCRAHRAGRSAAPRRAPPSWTAACRSSPPGSSLPLDRPRGRPVRQSGPTPPRSVPGCSAGWRTGSGSRWRPSIRTNPSQALAWTRSHAEALAAALGARLGAPGLPDDRLGSPDAQPPARLPARRGARGHTGAPSARGVSRPGLGGAAERDRAGGWRTARMNGLVPDPLAERLRRLSPDRLAQLVRGLQDRIDGLQARIAGPIAVVGMALRVPGAASPDAFWDLLCRGEIAITSVPEDRWSGAALARHGVPPYGGFLDSIDSFDATFFHIPPAEAAAMDPQQRPCGRGRLGSPGERRLFPARETPVRDRRFPRNEHGRLQGAVPGRRAGCRRPPAWRRGPRTASPPAGCPTCST